MNSIAQQITKSVRATRARSSVVARRCGLAVICLCLLGVDASSRQILVAQDAPVPPVEVVSGAWTLDQIETAALNGNPTLGQLQAKLEATRGRWVQAGLMPNALIGYNGQQLGSRGEAEQNGVLLQMEFVRLKKLRLNRAIVAEEIGMVEQQLAAQELRVLTDARIGFYDVLTAQRRVELNEELVEINKKAVQTAERLLNAKEVSRVDVLQARIEADQARILLENARQRYRAAWRGLSATIGQPQLEIQTLVGDLGGFREVYAWDESLQRLLGASPEISVAALNIERARQAVARARVENAPNLTLQGIVQYDSAVNHNNGGIQATFPIPIWNRNQGNIRAAEREVSIAEQNLQRLELSLQARLAPVFERYAVARNQSERYAKEIIPNAQESLELAQAAYRAGELGYISLLTAQRTFSQTNLAYLDSLRDLWGASLEIEGLLLTGSLDEPQ